jgi:hypothetical protein
LGQKAFFRQKGCGSIDTIFQFIQRGSEKYHVFFEWPLSGIMVVDQLNLVMVVWFWAQANFE